MAFCGVVEARDQRGDRALAATGRSHERTHASGWYHKRRDVQHVLLRAWVAEADVTELDTAGQAGFSGHSGFSGCLRAFLRLFLQHFKITADAHDALLEHVEKIDDPHHRHRHVSRIHVECEHLAERGRSVRHHPRAERDVQERISLQHELRTGVERRVERTHPLEREAEAVVDMPERPTLTVLAREALHLADALHGVLHVRGEGGGLLSVAAPHGVDAFLKRGGEQQDERNGQERPERKAHVEAEHHGEGACEHEDDFDECLRHEVRRGSHLTEVARDAAQNLARLRPVEIGEGQTLDVVEKLLAHGSLNSESKPLSAEGAAPFEYGRCHGEHGEGERRPAGRRKVASRQIHLKHLKGHHRNDKLESAAHHAAEDVHEHQPRVPAVEPEQRPRRLLHSHRHALTVLERWREKHSNIRRRHQIASVFVCAIS